MPIKPAKIKDFRGPENLKNFLGKRGYFFILDAVLATLVIAIGAILISSSYINIPKSTQVGLLSDGLMNFLSGTKIKDFNNQYAGIGGELWNQGMITDSENTLLQQAGQFYAENNLDVADKFIENASIGIIPQQFRYEVWIDGVVIYPKIKTSEHLASRNNTEILLTSKKITFGIMNKTTGELWGPYKAEVFVWQK